MPELPEVETTLRGITPHINQSKVCKVNIYNANLRWPIEAGLNKLLCHKIVNNILRRGKYLILEFDNGSLLLHLGMSGSLRVVPPQTPLLKHDHFEIVFNNNKILRLRDPRRFGAVIWTFNNWKEHKLISKLGPEPLSDDFNTDYIFAKTRKKSVAIKSFVMNSHIVVGVGNIYASEALFIAGIRPTTKAQRVSKTKLDKLVESIKQTLRKAIQSGGTTLKDFVQADGSPGYFEQQLFVYGRAGEDCSRCGETIKQKIINQRSSFYCPNCQC